MTGSGLQVEIAPPLRVFVRRAGRARGVDGGLVVPVHPGGRPSLGHVVQSIGVPLTEVGLLRVDGEAVHHAAPAPAAGVLEVPVRPRPQAAPTTPPRFVLDVHLGALARRMRLLGLDASYRNDADDDELLIRSVDGQRVLLTRDRGLLQRRALRWAAYVRGQHADEQLTDVLDRFAPPLRPWTRCPLCNGLLETVTIDQIADQLLPGTLQTYRDFARCTGCGRPFWQGAHARRLQQMVAAAGPGATARPS